MKCTHVCAAHKVLPNSDFSSLADEIAEACPDMNIKVAAFTVSEKSINTYTMNTWPKLHRVSVEL